MTFWVMSLSAARGQILLEQDLPDAQFGGALANVGDVDGDGFPDSVVSSPRETCTQTREGVVRLYLGGAPSITPAWSWCSGMAYVYAGAGVSGAGDTNGDGFDDLVVSWSYGVAVFLGEPGGLEPTPSWIGTAPPQSPGYGIGSAGAGDVNGDGYGDVIVGAYNAYVSGLNLEGAAYVYYGSPSGLPANPSVTLVPGVAGGWFGLAVAPAGDVNGDGYDDVIVGGPQQDAGRGYAYLYLGSGAGLATTPATVLHSNTPGANFGSSFAAGDVDGDGYGDVAIGAWAFYSSVAENLEGGVAVYHGTPTGLSPAPSFVRQSNQLAATLGRAVAMGDLDGDGFADLLVGTPGWDGGQTDEGKVERFDGSAAGLSRAPTWTRESNVAGAAYGSALASGGDANGDGYDDFGVGAPGWSDGEPGEGAAWFWFGRP